MPAWLIPLGCLLGGMVWMRALSEDRPEVATPFHGRHAIVFGLDGVRADALKLAVESGLAPNIAGLIESGAVTWNAMSGGWTAAEDDPTRQATSSGPGWSSVLTGVWTDKHGITNNRFDGSRIAEFPHFFRRLQEIEPAAEFASLVSWGEIHDHIAIPSVLPETCACLSYGAGNYAQRDEELTLKTLDLLRDGDPSVIFHYQGNPDAAGHGHGFSPEVPAYMEAIRQADERIGRVLAALRERPRFAGEDWLFVVTSDHGGIGHGHGGHTPEERVIPFVASGGAIPRGLISEQVIGQVAVPATVFRHLGLGIPGDWGWEADGFGNGHGLDAIASAGQVELRWSAPPRAEAASGFEVWRAGERLASLPPEARGWTDDQAPAGRQRYAIVPTGTGEGAWYLDLEVPARAVAP